VEPTEPGGAGDPGGPGAPSRPHGPAVHRLRDLSTRGRVVAGLLGACLVLGHVVTVVRFAPDWVPTGDVALMALRSYDALTSRLPLVGQPSTSGFYGGYEGHAFHPGPMQFYMTAPLIRLVGATVAMMAVAVVVTAASVLITAWALFRQLGAFAGVVGAVVISLLMFTAGPSTLVFPVSSSISGYPLMCGAVLVYALLLGDDRLLPLAVVVLSFAGQAHLSVGPTVGVLAAVGTAAVAWAWWQAGIRHDAGVRRHALLWGGSSLLVGLVLWAPVAYQQLTGNPGNITALWVYTSDDDKPTVGLGSAVGQVAHVLGLPPLLGRTDLSGLDLLEPVPLVTALSAAAVLAVLVVAGFRWRVTAPRRSGLVVMVLVLLPCALVTGASVPDSLERIRLSLYHWMRPLTVFAAVALAFVVADLARRVAGHRLSAGTRPRLAAAGIGLAAVAMVALPTVDLSLDRDTGTVQAAGAIYPRQVTESLVDQALDAGVDDIDGELVVVHQGDPPYIGLKEALSLAFTERGLDVAYPGWLRGFVDDDHLATPDELGAVLLVVSEPPGGVREDLPGEQVGWTLTATGIDHDAYEEAVASARGTDAEDFVPGPELERLLAGSTDAQRAFVETMVRQAVDDPRRAFADPGVVRFLAEFPTAAPALDRDAVARLDASLRSEPQGRPPAVALSIRLVEGDEARELLEFPTTPAG
jgi:hypothetical protein